MSCTTEGNSRESRSKGCGLEYYSSAIWLEQGDDQSEPESGAWESSESHCIHNCSSPRTWNKAVEAWGGGWWADMIKILVNLHQSLRGKGKKGKRKRALHYRSDHMSWVKLFFKRQLWYVKLPLRNELSLTPCCVHQIRILHVWLYMSVVICGKKKKKKLNQGLEEALMPSVI